MNLEDKIRSITFIPTEHSTKAMVELFNGFQFECESPYVSMISNAFGEKYCKEKALEMLKQFEQYMQAEQHFHAQCEKEPSWKPSRDI